MPSSLDRKSTRLNSSHTVISYAVFCLKKKKNHQGRGPLEDRLGKRLDQHPNQISRASPLGLATLLEAVGAIWSTSWSLFFFFNETATTEIYTLSLHDALPISIPAPPPGRTSAGRGRRTRRRYRDRKSTRLNSSHTVISYAVFCLKKKNKQKKEKNEKKKKKKKKTK